MFIPSNEKSELIMDITTGRVPTHADRNAAVRAFVNGKRGYQ